MKLRRFAGAFALWCLPAGPLWAQYSAVATPFHTTSNSFFEQTGVGFNFQHGNFFFQQNSLGSATPPFGGFTPGAGATFGFRTGHASFNFVAAQGSSTGMVSQSPSVTLPNGVPGAIFDVTENPFVISNGLGGGAAVSPVTSRLERMRAEDEAGVPRKSAASGGPAPIDKSRQPAGLNQKLNAAMGAADQPLLSVEEIKQLRSAGQGVGEQESLGLEARAKDAEAAGKTAVAKIYYRQAASRASGPRKQQLLDRAGALK